MLTALRVRDLVLIEALDLDLHGGFSVMTGETGAGKSILVGAIGLALGARGRAELVRAGAEAAEVEALFDVRDEPDVRRRLAEAGWEVSEEILVRRVLSKEGRSRCWVNGHPVPQAMLSELARGLAELSSQHEHHALADPGTHLFALDAFGKLDAKRAAVAEAHAAVVAAAAEVARLAALGAARADRLALLRHRQGELEALAPKRGEEADLRAEVAVLRGASRLLEAARGGEEALYSGEGAAVEVVASAAARLREAAEVDPTLGPVATQLQEAQALVEDAADQLRRYADRLEADPGRLAWVEDRLAAFQKLRRLLGEREADLVDLLEDLRRQATEIESHDELATEAARARDSAHAVAAELARALTAKRKATARTLAKAFQRELSDLGMGGARIEVSVAPAEPGEPSVDGARLSPTGVDRVEFLIAPNAGEPARPLARIASGGELSRAALALKRALAGVGPVGTSVFDEVDAGISGAVADMVGRKLLEVSRHHQVLSVTHLPQVAALADAHFKVVKAKRRDRTVTEVVRLDDEARVEEIARMISGSRVTERARAAAAELIASR